VFGGGGGGVPHKGVRERHNPRSIRTFHSHIRTRTYPPHVSSNTLYVSYHIRTKRAEGHALKTHFSKGERYARNCGSSPILRSPKNREKIGEEVPLGGEQERRKCGGQHMKRRERKGIRASAPSAHVLARGGKRRRDTGRHKTLSLQTLNLGATEGGSGS